MNLIAKATKNIFLFLIYAYLFVAMFVCVPYYNWQYAKENGFFRWLVLGEIVPTLKGAAWPYFAYTAYAEKQKIAQSVPDAPLREYVDHQYQFAFQFPANWKFEKNPPPGEAGEVRALIRHPTKAMEVMAMVGDIGKTITKDKFESSPNRDAVVEKMIELSLEQYRKTSQQIGAERMIVSEKRVLSSDVGIKFYISTAHIKGKVTMLMAGIHILPFEKPYMVTFMIISPADQTATKDNETITRVFNSFHLLGEHPIE